MYFFNQDSLFPFLGNNIVIFSFPTSAVVFVCHLVSKWCTIKCSDPVTRTIAVNSWGLIKNTKRFFIDKNKGTSLFTNQNQCWEFEVRLWPLQLIVITSLFQPPPSLLILHVLRSVSLWRAVTVICLLSKESSWKRDIYRSLKLQRATLMCHQS